MKKILFGLVAISALSFAVVEVNKSSVEVPVKVTAQVENHRAIVIDINDDWYGKTLEVKHGLINPGEGGQGAKDDVMHSAPFELGYRYSVQNPTPNEPNKNWLKPFKKNTKLKFELTQADFLGEETGDKLPHKLEVITYGNPINLDKDYAVPYRREKVQEFQFRSTIKGEDLRRATRDNYSGTSTLKITLGVPRYK